MFTQIYQGVKTVLPSFSRDCQVNDDLDATIAGIAHNKTVQDLAHAEGVAVQTVCWEDNARTKGSCWGPCITDMTLKKDNTNMPVIRKPNFSDITADRPIENFTVMVGNETGSELKQISLSEYLRDIAKYTGNANVESLLAERDTQVLTSGQACILPLCDGQVEFNVKLYNYQSTDSSDPAVLVIMASAMGTSAMVVYGNTDIYFNDNGTATNLKAKRLKDDRKERGVPIDGPMTTEEKNRNSLFVFQVPLKQKPRVSRSFTGGYYACAAACATISDSYSCEEDCDSFSDSFNEKLECCSDASFSYSEKRAPKKKSMAKSRGFDKAVLSKGSNKGAFTGTNNLTLTRNTDFPIRCTVQYYNVTDSPEVTHEQIKEIAKTVTTLYTGAMATGSLVVGTSDRVTETTVPKTSIPNDVPFVATSTPMASFI